MNDAPATTEPEPPRAAEAPIEVQAVVVSEPQAVRETQESRKGKAVRKAEKIPQRGIKTEQVFGTLRYAASCLDGGREAMLDYIRQAANLGSEVCQQFMVKHESLSLSEQETVPLDDVAASMELSVPNIVGTVVSVMTKLAHDHSNLIAALNKPKVVESLVSAASGRGIGSAQDRKTFLTMTGLLPSKHGPSVAVNINQKNIQQNGNSLSYESRVNRNAAVLQPEPEE